MTAKTSETVKADAKRALLAILDDGATVYTVLRSVSRSGMSRTIDLLYAVNNDPRTSFNNGILYLSGYAADLCGFTVNRKSNGMTSGRIVMRGCGMDMGYHAVETLARALGITLKQHWL